MNIITSFYTLNIFQVDGVYISPNDTLFLDLDKISVIHNTTIPGTDYSHIVMEVSKGVHTLVHENPTVTFGVMVYGLKKSESYGYPGGLRLALSGKWLYIHTLIRDFYITDDKIIG